MQDTSTDEEVQTLFLNCYECSECGTRWTDVWSCMCNDRCPKCSCEIEPYDSVEI
jgi:predicted Zn-ribbon and HTH transcriptional regulator